MANTASVTHFTGGLNQLTAYVKGGTAGSFTLTPPKGSLSSADKIIQVQALNWTTKSAISSITDLTSEFSITAANTINNTSGTNTTGMTLAVTYAITDPAFI